MSFMEPETCYTYWITWEDSEGCHLAPYTSLRSDYREVEEVRNIVESDHPAWLSRLSAPGYLDSTEWEGPYDSEKEALEALAETYSLCLDCWEDYEACDCVEVDNA